MKKILAASVIAFCAAIGVVQAQQAAPGGQPQQRYREDGLDPSPIGPNDPNIDMFIGDYRNAKPRTLYGKLEFRDILTRLEGPDSTHPTRKGAVLTGITSVSYTTLAPGAVATGRMQAGERQIFYTTGGAGQIAVNGKTVDVKEGIGFTLTPDFDFRLTNAGRAPLTFYVRTENIPAGTAPSPDLVVVNRYDNDRRVGAHWAHICNGGPAGLNLCTIAPRTMPQPHSHPGEEAWIMVKGETILSLGKKIVRMVPGQAYRIPPTGLAAHSNINLGDEPVQMIYMGPAVRSDNLPSARDFARLDNSPRDGAKEPDIDMFMGDWENTFPRIVHGNLYFRDMLTALQGPDADHPTRKGAVLTNATAVSYVQLEPGASAHPLDGELKGVQETYIVNSGVGRITSGGKTFELSKDKAFTLTPGMDFRMTAGGDKYLTFYVITEKVPEGFTPKAALDVIDNSSRPQTTAAWVNKERPLVSKTDGLSAYGAITQVELGDMAMSRPYSVAAGGEEIWIATEGETDMLFGKELRKLPAGTAYRVPSTGITAHAKVNTSGKPAKFLYMIK